MSHPRPERQATNDGRQAAPPGAFLTDFGLAKSVATGSKLTRTGQALGTPATMSPEQARGETASLSPATDVWGLGCVLYELLAGRRAFEGETDAEVVARVLTAKPPRLRALRPDAPAALSRAVAACLSKDAADRYADAGLVRDDLDRLLRGEAVRAPRPRRREWRLVSALFLLGAIAWVAWALAAARPPPPGPPRESRAGPAETLAARARDLRHSDPRGASDLLRRALEAEPRRDDLRVERGIFLWAAGDGAGAREEWSRVPGDSSQGPRASLYLGLEASFGFRGHEAAPHYEAAARGTGPEATLARGALAERRGDVSAAREILRGLAGWEAALLRAHVESGAPDGDPARSVAEYGRALEEGPPFGWAMNNRGALRRKLGDLDGARLDLDEAVRRLPDVAAARLNRAALRIRLGDLRGALEDFDAALRLSPDNPMALADRGVVHKDLGDFPAALADFDASLRVRPEEAVVLSNRGAMRRALGDLTSALEDYDAALRLSPDDPETLFNRGNLRRALRDTRGGIADYDEALRLRPDFAMALANRGVARKTLGDTDGALADFEAAIRAQPGLPGPHANVGYILHARGEFRGAAAALARFLRLAPDHPDAPEARSVLAECERRLEEGGEGTRGTR